MSELELPAIHPRSVPSTESGSDYPEPFRSRLTGVLKQRLGDFCGLTKLGVNLVIVQPGAQSSVRHWHSHEDELVYVLTGELTLITDQGEQVLTAGMAAGFPAGVANGHQLVNRGNRPARYLEVGNRVPGDQVTYPDDDLIWVDTPAGEIAAHKDGTPYDQPGP